MIRLYTASEMAACDKRTIEQLGIPSLILMERASLAIAEEVQKELTGKEGARVLCVCGSGNNGGDGAACARILHMRGIDVSLHLLGDPSHRSPEMQTQLLWAQRLGIPMDPDPEWDSYTVIVDAIFGIGISREVSGAYRNTIEMINRFGRCVIAADIPSGIHADTGAVMGAAVCADTTVTMQHAKIGLFVGEGRIHAGNVTIAEIGILPLAEQLFSLDTSAFTQEDLIRLLPRRRPDGNKGTFGKVLVIAGSKNMCGAAYLAAYAALRTGAGMVKILTHETNRVILQQMLPEAMLSTYENFTEALDELDRGLRWCDAAAIGPGLGTDENAQALVGRLILNASCPVVADADALNVISAEGGVKILTDRRASFYITPHLKEAERLTGVPVQQIRNDSVRFAAAIAARCGIICVLKDAVTVTAAPQQIVRVNTTGNDGMATAGSGDTLTGMLAGLLAQGMRGIDAASAAVCLHGSCGDLAAARLGRRFMKAADITDSLSEYLKDLEGQGKEY